MPPDNRLKLKYLLSRAIRNEDLSRDPKLRVFGREFTSAYNLAVKMQRETHGRRESGQPNIVHSVEVALGMLGFCNIYGLETDNHPLRGITPYDIITSRGKDGVTDFEVVCICTALLHDVIEDRSKTPEDIEKHLEELSERLSMFDPGVRDRIVQNVDVLTNKYSRVLRASRLLGSSKKDIFDAAEENLGKLIINFKFSGLDTYVKLAETLIEDIGLLRIKRDTLDGSKRRDFLTTFSTPNGLANHLSYRTYDHYMLDMLYNAERRFRSGDGYFDVSLLIKRQDAMHNVATMNLSDRDKIRRALAKAEIVVRRLSNEALNPEYPNPLEIPDLDRSEGFVDFVGGDRSEEYSNMIHALALQLRYLMIRACVNRIEAIENIDAVSVVAQMRPFLKALERKYREIYIIEDPVVILDVNPLAGIWRDLNGHQHE